MCSSKLVAPRRPTHTHIKKGLNLNLIGYGVQEKNGRNVKLATVLQKTKVPVLPDDKCKQYNNE